MNRSIPVILALLIGLILGVVAAGFAVPNATTVGGADQEPPYSYLASTAVDVDSALDTDSGWVHEISIEDRIAVTGNATVVHDADDELRLRISQTESDTYEFAFETVPARNQSKSTGDVVATTITWGVGLPADYEMYVISFEETEIARFSNDAASTARLHRLPHPLA